MIKSILKVPRFLSWSLSNSYFEYDTCYISIFILLLALLWFLALAIIYINGRQRFK